MNFRRTLRTLQLSVVAVILDHVINSAALPANTASLGIISADGFIGGPAIEDTVYQQNMGNRFSSRALAAEVRAMEVGSTSITSPASEQDDEIALTEYELQSARRLNDALKRQLLTQRISSKAHANGMSNSSRIGNSNVAERYAESVQSPGNVTLWAALIIVSLFTLCSVSAVAHHEHWDGPPGKGEYQQTISSSSTRDFRSAPGSAAVGAAPMQAASNSFLSDGPTQIAAASSMQQVSRRPFFPELTVKSPGGDTLILDGNIRPEPQEEVLRVCKHLNKALILHAYFSESGGHKGVLIETNDGHEAAYISSKDVLPDGQPCAKISSSSTSPPFAVCVHRGQGWVLSELTPAGEPGQMLLQITPAAGVYVLTVQDSRGALTATLDTREGKYLRLAYGADVVLVLSAVIAAVKVPIFSEHYKRP